MNIIHATGSNFKEVVGGDLVLVDFFADWCGPCQMLAPILEDMSNDRDMIKIVKVNVDNEHELAKDHGVMSIPTLCLYKNGSVIDKKVGFMTKEDITEWINENK